MRAFRLAPTAVLAISVAAAPYSDNGDTTAAPRAIQARALNYSIPAAWPEATVTGGGYDYLNHVAQEAIYYLKKDYWKDANKLDWGWTTGTTLGAFAYKDMVASTRDNYDFVKAALAAAKRNNKNFDPYGYNDDAQWWGTTAFYAYRAYGDQVFLQYAKDVWNWVQRSQITAAQATAGKSPVRAKEIRHTCNTKGTAGGVFWRSESSDKTDMSVNVITTGLFETLSAYLAEATGEQKYKTAAINAYSFITTHLFKADPNIPTDSMNINTCVPNNWIFTYNTGKFVEGAVVLSKVTGDNKYRDQALKTIVDAVTRVSNWQDKQGLITEGQDGDPTKGGDGRQFKSIYIRALTEVGRREYKNSGLHTLLKRYVNINFKRVRSDDTDDKGRYGVVWKGPYTKSESGQMNVLDLFVAGIEFNWAAMLAPLFVVTIVQAYPSSSSIHARALNYTIPAAWPAADVTQGYDYINNIAQTAINNLKNDYWKDATKLDWGWVTGTTLGALAYKDNVASTRANYAFVKAALAAAKKNNKNFDPHSQGYNDDAQWWGTTAYYAYRTYGDQEFLQYAKDVWNWVQRSQITAAEAQAGKSAVRAAAIKSTCNGKTTAGGVFWRSESSDKTDMGVNVVTTGLFQTLSAYLAGATGEQKYKTAAINAYTFIVNQLFKADPNIPTDGMSISTCSANNWIFTYNTGKFVEGAVVLSHVTGDGKYRDQALKTIVDAVTRVTNWQDNQGRITEGQDGDPTKGGDGRQFKAIYLRALTEVSRREYTNSGLRALLKRYININYKTVLADDTDGNGHYGVVWKGPYTKSESGQMNVLDLFVAGVEFNWAR
ncbi:Six-hairpin glycosidase [Auricularia subglabra TFB-10046 SS5]|nr:Six-hairpin glycosidase [Auricularia subglabra TFB-10046 SS5]